MLRVSAHVLESPISVQRSEKYIILGGSNYVKNLSLSFNHNLFPKHVLIHKSTFMMINNFSVNLFTMSHKELISKYRLNFLRGIIAPVVVTPVIQFQKYN